MLKKYSLRALQIAINKALSLDPDTPQKFAALSGKTLEIVIAPLNANFFMQFSTNELLLLARFDGHPDTIIHSNPIGLIRLSILPASKARSLFNDKIRMSGDIELGQKVKQIFDELDIDWEGHLAHFTGDVVAYQIGSLVRRGLSFGKSLDRSMRESMSEYIQEELKILPARNELESFYREVDQLALDTERLQAHINHLSSCYEID